jgi:glycosyltransferase involved in cell wall biosynthesis
MCVLLSGRPAAIIVNSEAGRRVHEAIGYRARHWFVLPNGFDTQAFVPDPKARTSVREELGVPATVLLIGMMARYHPQKDHSTFLEAARLLSASRPEVHFVLAGRDIVHHNACLRHQVDATGLANRIHLLGERDDVPRLTAALDVATLSASFGEGFPGVICEAMACGVPVAVTDVGDAARIVGDSGRVAPPRNPRALAETWRTLLDLPAEERQRLGRIARERIASKWSIDEVVRKYESVYLDVTNGRSAPAKM